MFQIDLSLPHTWAWWGKAEQHLLFIYFFACLFVPLSQSHYKRSVAPGPCCSSWKPNQLTIYSHYSKVFTQREKEKRDIMMCYYWDIKKERFLILFMWTEWTWGPQTLDEFQCVCWQPKVRDYKLYYLGLFSSIYALFPVVQHLIQSSKQHNMCDHGPNLLDSVNLWVWHGNSANWGTAGTHYFAILITRPSSSGVETTTSPCKGVQRGTSMRGHERKEKDDRFEVMKQT